MLASCGKLRTANFEQLQSAEHQRGWTANFERYNRRLFCQLRLDREF